MDINNEKYKYLYYKYKHKYTLLKKSLNAHYGGNPGGDDKKLSSGTGESGNAKKGSTDPANFSKPPVLSASPPGKSEDQVIVFDFDMTFISEHSKGYPLEHLGPFTGNLGQVYNDLLNDLKTRFKHIFINTRGMEAQILPYLAKQKIDTKLITRVFGANSATELGSEYWPQLKLQNLNTIAKDYKISKRNVYFYDDTQANITEALKEFPNSILVNEITGNGPKLLKYAKALYKNN